MKKPEIYILSGFLGSGKTTLLKNLLKDEREHNRKVAVMMNELGSVSIDSGAVGEDVELKEMLGGCICCTISGQVEAQLQGLLQVKGLEAIYIEATGAAHPVEVLDAILSPLFANLIDIKGIISTVDGLRWRDRELLGPQLQRLMLEQVRHADYIIINKMDQLSESEQAAVTYGIQGINPAASCILTVFSKVPIQALRQLSLSPFKKQGEKLQIKKDIGLSTFVHQFSKTVSRSEFEDFLRNLPDTIYRMKGYVKFDGSSYPELFQFSYGMPSYIKEQMNLPLNMVFIGESVDWAWISSKLNALENQEN